MPEHSSSNNSPKIITRHEYHKHTGPRWPLIVGLLFAALIIAIALVFGVRWAYRSIKNSPNPATHTVPANTKKLPKAPPSSGALGPGKAASPAAQSKLNPPAKTLPNTGG